MSRWRIRIKCILWDQRVSGVRFSLFRYFIFFVCSFWWPFVSKKLFERHFLEIFVYLFRRYLDLLCSLMTVRPTVRWTATNCCSLYVGTNIQTFFWVYVCVKLIHGSILGLFCSCVSWFMIVLRVVCRNTEVEGIQGSGPRILLPDHGDNPPPLRAVSPPPIN